MPFQKPDMEKLGKSKPARIAGLLLILAIAAMIAIRPDPPAVNAPADLALVQGTRCEALMTTWKDRPQEMTPALKRQAETVCKAAAVSKVKAEADK